jgi:hypothetical protein
MTDHTDIPQSKDPQVRSVFLAMQEAIPGIYYPETTCAEKVAWARALVAAGVLKGGE